MQNEQTFNDKSYTTMKFAFIKTILKKYTVESRMLDKSNSRCLEQNNRPHPYHFTPKDYSISRSHDVSNKFFVPLTVRDIESLL